MDLYALAPEDFTAARDAEVRAARSAGDRERARRLGALRRPTVSAYAVNALVRAEPGLVDSLVDLGRQLGEAQAGGRRDALRELGEQRRRLVEAVADRAGDAAGRPLTAAVRAEVTATLEAALADPASGAAVRTGRLVRPLSYAGFGGVDLDGAVADAPAPEAPAPRPRRDDGPDAVERARRTAQEAAGALDDAVQAAERAEQARGSRRGQAQREAEEADRAEREAGEARAEAEQAAREAERRAAEAERAASRAERARRQAEAAAAEAGRAEAALRERHAAVAAAQAAAEQARAALDRLTRAPRRR